MLGNGTYVVKKLVEKVDIYEKEFSEEIVQLLTYCSYTRGEMVDCNREIFLVDLQQSLLCFEYLEKESLNEQITGNIFGSSIHVLFNDQVLQLSQILNQLSSRPFFRCILWT
jgi:hypothetical protein